LYQFYSPAPPCTVLGTPNMHQNTPQWGDPVLETELYSLEDLEDFNSSNFSCLFEPKEAIASPEPEDVLQPTQAEVVPCHTPHNVVPIVHSAPKQPMLITGSLINIVPRVCLSYTHLSLVFQLIGLFIQPHSIPSPYIADPFRGPLDCKPFPTTQAIEIVPQSLPLNIHSFSRRAWIVPLRGILPWDHASNALIIEADPSSQSIKYLNTILWTPDAVSAFWAFFVSLQKGTKFGPIGLSFQQASERPHTLKDVDYLKIYHEISISLHLRTAIDEWEHEFNVGGSTQGNKRVALLKGMRFALLDEASKALFTL